MCNRGKDQQTATTKGYECEIVEHRPFNEMKVVFYTYQPDLINAEKLKEGLHEYCQVTKLIPAYWIQIKNMKTTAFLATFEGRDISQYIEIPGEQAKSMLYEHILNSISGNTYQSYEHAEKYCKN